MDILVIRVILKPVCSPTTKLKILFRFILFNDNDKNDNNKNL